MSTPRKRKFIDLTSDAASPKGNKRRTKKAKLTPPKSAKPVAFAQQDCNVCPLPPLEKDERFRKESRCKDESEDNNNTNTNTLSMDTAITNDDTVTTTTSSEDTGDAPNPKSDSIDVSNSDDDPIDDTNASPPSPTFDFKVNQWVYINDDDADQKAQILKQKETNGNILFLIHYDQRSSLHDEWIPKHKLRPIPDTEDEDEDEDEEGEKGDSNPTSNDNANSNSSGDDSESGNDEDTNQFTQESYLTPPSPPSESGLSDVMGGSVDLNEDSNPSSPRKLNQRLINLLSSLDREPAKTFPFELDHFQFNAIKSLETESVDLLITAHTSAGKTVVAEYAIAKALANNQRVIYTSPIKALSNQKYREFTEKFGHQHIGLVTGDVTKRKDASVLVMTTEILRNMLYKGGAELREVAYVVFDEVHYMRDMERGVVWEESIILLNTKITLIFLSATLSNAEDFALWVTDLKGKTCRVYGTEKRPIVLEHYVLPQGSDSLYLVASSATKNRFLAKNFEHAQNWGEMEKTYRQMEEQKKRNKLRVSDLQLLLYMLYKNKWVPAIVFAFSKREVEAHALALNDAINLCTPEESGMIEDVFNNAIDALTDKDKELPAVQSLLPLLRRGIGVHHGGILPILKEVTEILFQEGMIKVLFATETFAMGVNMPARCVVFSGTEKYDGKSVRTLESGEYIQMSGRAGRRGTDDKGIVIMMMNDMLTMEQCRGMMCGKSAALTSSFRLTYNMLLNISKNMSGDSIMDTKGDGEDDDGMMEEQMDGSFSYQAVIEKSFYRFLMTQRIPQIEGRIKSLREILNEMESAPDFDAMKLYFDLYHSKCSILRKANEMMKVPYILNKYLHYGRLVHITVTEDAVSGDNEEEEEKMEEALEFKPKTETVWGWGVVLGTSKRYQPDKFFVDILIPSAMDTEMENVTFPVPVAVNDEDLDLKHPVDFRKLNEKQKMKYGLSVVRYGAECISKVSSVRLRGLPPRILSDEDHYMIWKKVLSAKKHCGGSIPVLDPLEDMNVLVLYKESNKIAMKEEFEETLPKLDQRMKSTAYFDSKFKDKKESVRKKEEEVLYALYEQYQRSKREMAKLTKHISTYNVGQFAVELKMKCRVLRKLEYLNEENILTPKGIVASHLEISHEILITELMFDNFFNNLSSEDICAVMSVLIMERPSKKSQTRRPAKVQFPVPPSVHHAYEAIVNKARDILCTKRECGLTEEFGLFEGRYNTEDDYLQCFSPDLITCIYQWVNGADFAEINKLTDLFEGALIRLIKRLRDVINQMLDAAKAIGNDELHKKFSDSIEKLQRGIVFAASLYVDDMEDEDEDDDEGDEDDEEGSGGEVENEGEGGTDDEDDDVNEDLFGDEDME